MSVASVHSVSARLVPVKATSRSQTEENRACRSPPPVNDTPVKAHSRKRLSGALASSNAALSKCSQS